MIVWEDIIMGHVLFAVKAYRITIWHHTVRHIRNRNRTKKKSIHGRRQVTRSAVYPLLFETVSEPIFLRNNHLVVRSAECLTIGMENRRHSSWIISMGMHRTIGKTIWDSYAPIVIVNSQRINLGIRIPRDHIDAWRSDRVWLMVPILKIGEGS